MYYPWLDVPILTAPMLIAFAASFFALIFHYAVGGSIIFAWQNSRALRENDKTYREYLKNLLGVSMKSTLALGSIFGVGAWFVIGVFSPLAAEILVKTFAFVIAAGWVFLFLAIVSALTLYYNWDKQTPRASRFTGWSLAIASLIWLVLITAPTSFMLNSAGLVGDWNSTQNFWNTLFNVQYLPQVVTRIGGAFTLSACFILLHAAVFEKKADIRERVTRSIVIPAFGGLLLTLVGVVGWLLFLPESGLAALERSPAANICTVLFVISIVVLTVLLIVGPTINPRETNIGTALALSFFGIAVVGVGELTRDSVRKPFVIDQIAFSNQITRADVKRTREEGLLYTGVWTNYFLDRLQEKEEYQELNISSERYLGRKSIHIVKQELRPRNDLKEDNEGTHETSEGQRSDDNVSEGAEDKLSQGIEHEFLGLNTLDFVTKTAAQVHQNAGHGNTRFEPVQTVKKNDGARPPVLSSGQQVTTPGSVPRVQPQDASVSVPTSPTVLPPTSQEPIENNGASPHKIEPAKIEPPVQISDDKEDSDVPFEEEGVEEKKGIEKTPAELDEELYGLPAEGNDDLLKLSESDRLLLGRAIYLHHCSSCHAAKHGYSALGPIVAGCEQIELAQLALELNFMHYYMPPWAGTQVEAMLLAEYLVSIGSQYPKNIFEKPKTSNINREDSRDAVAKKQSETEAE